MSVHVRSNFQDVFDNLLAAIDTVYFQSRDLDETKAPWKKIFAVRKSDRQFENVTGFGGFGQFGTVAEGASIPLMTVPQLYDKKFTHTKWAGAWSVTEEMEDDDQYELVANMARAFARAFRFTKEVNMANVLNNGFTTELAADGSAIFAAHTLWNGGTLTNGVSTDFGVSAAQTMYNYFATLTDDRGLRVSLKPSIIVANPAMRWVISEVMKSQLKPYTTDNELNALKEESLDPIYWAEISDTDAWFAFAKPSDVNGLGLRIYNRKDFTTNNDTDISNLTMLSVGRGRWSRGCIDFRQGYGSQGA